MKQRLVIVAAFVAVLTAGATACATSPPIASGGPAVPVAGCYNGDPVQDLEFSGVIAQYNALFHRTDDGTCSGGVFQKATLVPATNVNEADAQCRIVTGEPSVGAPDASGPGYGIFGLTGYWFCADWESV